MASKKLTNNGSSTITLGLDVGYGVTKAVTAQDTVTFPSVAGYSREVKFRAEELATKYPGDQIIDHDGEWFIGDLARSQLKAHEQISLRGRTANESALGNAFRLRFAKVAIGKLFPGRRNGDVLHIRLATGLPVDHMPDAAELKQALIGQHLIKTDQTEFVANITEVMVMPQPYGTLYRNMLMPSGEYNPCHTATRSGVVDIGTYTIDLALDAEGEYIEAESGSIEGGVYTAQERIAEMIEREFREKPRNSMVETVLRTGCLKAKGKEYNYSEAVAEALEPLRTATLTLMSAKWAAGLNVDVIYVSGGGAELAIEDIAAAYPQAQLVENAQLANAQGYLNYANFAALE